MLKNQFKTAFRNLWKDRSYTLLNMLGLTTGIVFSLFLILYNLDELSYDRFNRDAVNIYRISGNAQEPKQFLRQATSPFMLGQVLQNGFPEVESAIRLVPYSPLNFKLGGHTFNEEKVYVSDPNIFAVFNYPLLKGTYATALVQPNSIVINRTMAVRYFGSVENALGKSLYSDASHAYRITGIMNDIPLNSHIRIHALISRSSLPKDYSSYWGGFEAYTYVRLKPQASLQSFIQKLKLVSDKYLNVIFKPAHVSIFLQPQRITSIHLHSKDRGEPEELGNMSYIYIFSAVAVCMLLIATINYVNMGTARASTRAREVGIRKVSGSTKGQLIFQFITESVLNVSMSVLLSLVALILLRPYFNTLSGKQINLETLFQPAILWVLILIVFLCGLVAGTYPAVYLAQFGTVQVLKGNLSRGRRGIVLRRSLVVFQFGISLIMLTSTLIVYEQLSFLRNKDLGFTKDHVMTLFVKGDQQAVARIPAFLHELRKMPQVLASGTASSFPGQATNFTLMGVETGSGMENRGLGNYSIDRDYLPALGIQIREGRNFSGLAADTSASVLVNEALVKAFGWKISLGKRIRTNGQTIARVIGVVKDFNQQSLYNPIAPLVFSYAPVNQSLEIRLDPKSMGTSISSIGRIWKGIFPELPFDYSFIDKDFDSQYRADEQRGQIFSVFSALTIAISCLGLLGLIGYTTEQRKKEISIRKVLGAKTSVLVSLLTKEFVTLILLSAALAFPLAWIFMHSWLAVFPYHTQPGWTSFALAFGLLTAVTFITVSYHTLRSSLANPVNNLRSE